MIRIKMVPHYDYVVKGPESGIKRVVIAYHNLLPKFDIHIVDADAETGFDLIAAHAGIMGGNCDVSHTHGLYWTSDYIISDNWEYRINQKVVESIRNAKEVTVPSAWVAETFQRDMRFTPHIIPHGIVWEDWQHEYEQEGYVLWNKNRAADVCHPGYMIELARANQNIPFLTTISMKGSPINVNEIGMMSHPDMKRIIQKAGIYLSTTKETFGIGVLEAMASGVPILGFAFGGNLDLVKHGINGYLAEPNNMEDLHEGLAYCFEHRKTLGDNGRELAKSWSWEAACEKVAEVYQLALQSRPPTASIVIPCFNYEDKVGRAIESAINQTYSQLDQIIVVDDGSYDQAAIAKAVEIYSIRDGRVRLIRQDRAGVANARNRGITEAGAVKYICCLDADDAIEPEFLTVCIKELEEDRSLGIAYTSLRWIKPDGSEGLSQWPGEFNYDEQLKRRNQVPTCCVFQKEMWERLKGYRQRYAPDGAGSEDAEFWTRAGAIGYGARKVTHAPLFIYSWMSGQVTSNPSYQEPDWLAWHPWAWDGEHPFASVASPKRISHKVRQYDEPVISVIIPVGPGHEKELINALDSLDAQSFRKWEAIVVNDMGEKFSDALYKAFPHVKWLRTMDGKHGAGYARNRGAEFSRAPFLFFLDADDWLTPNALLLHYEAWQMEEAIIYSNYVGKAFIAKEDLVKLAPDLQERIYRHREDGETIIGYRAFEYDPERAQRQPQLEGPQRMPYIWCNVSALIPKDWHFEIGGFDISLKSWEDVDYHWRMARAGKCYLRIEEELLVYQFYTGSRRDAGLQHHQDLIQYLTNKYKEIEIVPCNCGGRRTVRTSDLVGRLQATLEESLPMEETMKDADFVMVRYLHPNRGQHQVKGPITGRDYGYKGGGEVFLVHRDDIQAAPHLFQSMERTRVERMPQVSAPRPIEPPQSIIEAGPQPGADPLIVETMEAMNAEEKKISEALEQPFDFQTVPGITAPIAKMLRENGINDLADVVALGEEGLLKYKGIGKMRAQAIMEAASKIMEQ